MRGAASPGSADIAELRLVAVIGAAVLLLAAIVVLERPEARAAADGVRLAGPGGCCAHAAVDDDRTARVGYMQMRVRPGSPESLWSAVARPGAVLPVGGRLLRLGPGRISSGSQVFAWDGRGRAVAAWRGAAREVDASARGVRVYVAAQRADGSWTAPQTLSRPRDALYPVLAVDRAGNAIVAWSARTRRGWRVEVAQRSAGRARFGRARAISATSDDSTPTAVAVAGARWVVAWAASRAVRVLTGTGATRRTRALPARGASIYPDWLSVAVGRDGTVGAAWREQAPTTNKWRRIGAVVAPGARTAVVRRLGPDQSTLHDADGAVLPDVDARVVVTPGGETVFAVPRYPAGTLGIISVARGASSWTAPETLGPGDGTDVHLHAADDGRIAAIWTTYWSPDKLGVHVAVRPPGGPFAPAVALARDPEARWPAVAIHGDRLAAAWLSEDPYIRGVAQTLP